jgi:opacity protein-like surface antigen
MKKRILIIAGCTIILSISSIAHSAQGPYVSGNLGLAVLNDSDWTDSTIPGITLNIESDSGLALGVAAGYDLGNNIRVEGEIAYQQNDLDKVSAFGVDVDLAGDTSSLAFLLNGYYDFVTKSVFTPFVSAGLGFTKVEVNDFNVPGSGLPSSNDDDTVFAYQVGAGVDYAVNEKITIDFKYRYLGTSDPEFDTSTVEYSSHNFYAGIRAAF